MELKKRASITCPACGRISFNPNDVLQKYCGFCHRFQEDIWESLRFLDPAVISDRQRNPEERKVVPGGEMSHEAKIERLLEHLLHEVRALRREVAPPQLASITIVFSKGTSMTSPVAGPITLTTVGQKVTASVLGYDQFGSPFTGTIPTPTFASSDSAGAVATFDPATGLVTAVANGTANITATLTTAEGLSLSDTEAVTVAIGATTGTPVLTTIKVAFA